jgi:AbrB family looped-hinge helix DNA binding protein
MSSITSPGGRNQLDEPLPGVLEAGALVRCGTITTWPTPNRRTLFNPVGNRGRLVLPAEVRGRLDLQDGDRIILRSTMKVPCAWSAPGR